jgi:hypothetical protein
MTLTESQKRGVVATAVFHTGVILLFLFFGFITPYPPLPEGGILLDFGNSETGIGLEEPSASQQPVKQRVEIKSSKVVSKSQAKSKANDAQEENLLTQEMEQSLALNTTLKKKIENDKKIKLEEERILKEKLDKRRRDEEIEQQRLAEAERIKKEEAAKISTLNSRAKNAFGGGKTDNGSQSKGQGVTYGPGNQGSQDGTPGAKQYGLGGGSGNGTGNGTSFSLAGRSAQSLPKPNFPGNEAGIVVVEVTVNKFGKVTEALPGVKGTNTLEPQLFEAAKKAAMSASFNSDATAPAFQKGTITYHFVLQ